jgi:hypothetical protein
MFTKVHSRQKYKYVNVSIILLVLQLLIYTKTVAYVAINDCIIDIVN